MSEFMEIDKNKFDEQFTKMGSLLNKSVNKDQMLHWYKKAKHFHSGHFEETVDQFVELGKFPIWSDFRRAYKRIEASHGVKKVVGCEYCDNGWVYFWRKPKCYGGENGTDVSFSDRCKLCNPDKYGAGYDAQSNHKNRRLIDYSTPYPHGQEGYVPPKIVESPTTVDGKPTPLLLEGSKPGLQLIAAQVGVQVNTPEESQEFTRKLALEKDFEREIKSAREGNPDFPWF